VIDPHTELFSNRINKGFSMSSEAYKLKLAAILSADVEGYSRLMDGGEEAPVRTLTTYQWRAQNEMPEVSV
jgi:hypothetical protein